MEACARNLRDRAALESYSCHRSIALSQILRGGNTRTVRRTGFLVPKKRAAPAGPLRVVPHDSPPYRVRVVSSVYLPYPPRFAMG